MSIRDAVEADLPAIVGIFAHNEPSLKLFEGFGFERWAHFPRVAELDGVERDLVVVSLRLEDAA